MQVVGKSVDERRGRDIQRESFTLNNLFYWTNKFE